MSNEELISRAAAVIKTRRNGDFIIGDVGCALETEDGNLHLGVCIDTSSSLGFCAEANAIGAMTTAGEARIRRIVAVWKGEKWGDEGAAALRPVQGIHPPDPSGEPRHGSAAFRGKIGAAQGPPAAPRLVCRGGVKGQSLLPREVAPVDL